MRLLPVIIASRVALILSDVVVLGVTWMVTHTYRSQDILREFGRKTTLAGVLYQNGASARTRSESADEVPSTSWD